MRHVGDVDARVEVYRVVQREVKDTREPQEQAVYREGHENGMNVRVEGGWMYLGVVVDTGLPR